MNNITKNVQVRLDKMDNVLQFTAITNQYDFTINLSQADYTVDAKSAIEIFSLDLSKNLTLTAQTNENTDLFDKIKSFMVK